MKMLRFEKKEILDYEEKISHKRRKRKSGILATLFKN